VLLNFLSAKKSKGSQGGYPFFVPPPPPPPYTEPSMAELEKVEIGQEEKGWLDDIDGKSLMSASSMSGSQKSSRSTGG